MDSSEWEELAVACTVAASAEKAWMFLLRLQPNMIKTEVGLQNTQFIYGDKQIAIRYIENAIDSMRTEIIFKAIDLAKANIESAKTAIKKVD